MVAVPGAGRKTVNLLTKDSDRDLHFNYFLTDRSRRTMYSLFISRFHSLGLVLKISSYASQNRRRSSFSLKYSAEDPTMRCIIDYKIVVEYFEQTMICLRLSRDQFEP